MLGMLNRFFKKKTVPEPPLYSNPIPLPPPVLPSGVYSIPTSSYPHITTGAMYMSGSYIPTDVYGTSQEELREKANKFKKFSVTPNQKASSFKKFSLTPKQTSANI